MLRNYTSATPKPPGGLYQINMASAALTKAPGFEGLGDGAGIWSDGTTMWVATPGRLKAYNLANGARRPNLDVGLHWGREPGDIWSDGETIWVTYRTEQTIEAYRLPQISD